jgi:DNA polymerase-3 subunit delta'
VSALPEPRANPLLVGHAAAEAQLADAMRSSRLHHAWLFTGPQGIGKATLAFRFARRLLAGGMPETDLSLPDNHPTFRRVAAGTHADLLTASYLHLTPAEGGWRVVVVDGAEDLNRNAENALLKMLEEPPPRAILLLVSGAAGRLLPTIRSRCRRLRLDPLAGFEMDAILAQALPDLDAPERDRLITLAEGSPGRALQFAGGGGVGMSERVAGVLRKLPDLGADEAYATADALGRGEDAFTTFMDLLRASLSTAVREAARGRADPAQARLLGKRPLAAWVDVWHALTQLQRETEDLYLDKRQALVDSFALLAHGT